MCMHRQTDAARAFVPEELALLLVSTLRAGDSTGPASLSTGPWRFNHCFVGLMCWGLLCVHEPLNVSQTVLQLEVFSFYTSFVGRGSLAFNGCSKESASTPQETLAKFHRRGVTIACLSDPRCCPENQTTSWIKNERKLKETQRD